MIHQYRNSEGSYIGDIPRGTPTGATSNTLDKKLNLEKFSSSNKKNENGQKWMLGK